MSFVLNEAQKKTWEWLGFMVLAVILFFFILIALAIFLSIFIWCVVKNKGKEAELISGGINAFLLAGFTRLIWFFFGGRSPILTRQPTSKTITKYSE